MKTLKEKLIELRICEDAVKWTADKTIEEAWATCPRGDWMLCLFAKTNPEDIKLLFLAKGHCANTVRHSRHSIKNEAIDAAIAFGNGKITKQELDKAANGAWDDSRAGYGRVASEAASEAASKATYYSDYYAVSADYYAATAAASATAKTLNQLLTANICRKYLPVPTI